MHRERRPSVPCTVKGVLSKSAARRSRDRNAAIRAAVKHQELNDGSDECYQSIDITTTLERIESKLSYLIGAYSWDCGEPGNCGEWDSDVAWGTLQSELCPCAVPDVPWNIGANEFAPISPTIDKHTLLSYRSQSSMIPRELADCHLRCTTASAHDAAPEAAPVEQHFPLKTQNIACDVQSLCAPAWEVIYSRFDVRATPALDDVVKVPRLRTCHPGTMHATKERFDPWLFLDACELSCIRSTCMDNNILVDTWTPFLEMVCGRADEEEHETLNIPCGNEWI
eukprot:TRINITY_DN21830_c0_g2_i1.p1 TRINITY_DN21830_c0_g2~~TRINITY_DN21830_c0_g2_i1.p1  ORF type:complete len:282 (-),score=28.54 TRINITY_DN21830_c0_g2_i1:210-1055(-)